MYHITHPENSAKGGSAVTIKENIRHSEETKFEAEDIQATVVDFKTKNYDMIIINLYCPPKHNIKAGRYSKLFEFVGDRFIMGGDFNAKCIQWGSRLITTKGKELLKVINENKCEVISTGKPMYCPWILRRFLT